MAGPRKRRKRRFARLSARKKIIWIDEGLKNDHTDGHIDNIARFVAPGRVVCQSPAGADDPNAETLNAIARDLEAATDARGRKLEIDPHSGRRPLSQRAWRGRRPPRI